MMAYPGLAPGGVLTQRLPDLRPLQQGAQAVLDALGQADPAAALTALQGNPAALLYQRLVTAGRADQARTLIERLAGVGQMGQELRARWRPGGWGGPGGENPTQQPGGDFKIGPPEEPVLTPGGDFKIAPQPPTNLATRLAATQVPASQAARLARLRSLLGTTPVAGIIRSRLGV